MSLLGNLTPSELFHEAAPRAMTTDLSSGVVQFLHKNVLQSIACGCLWEPKYGVDELR